MWCVFPLLMEACLDFETDPKAVVVLYMMRIMRWLGFCPVAATCFGCDSSCCGFWLTGHGVYSGGKAPAGHPWPSASMLSLPRCPGAPCHEELWDTFQPPWQVMFAQSYSSEWAFITMKASKHLINSIMNIRFVSTEVPKSFELNEDREVSGDVPGLCFLHAAGTINITVK